MGKKNIQQQFRRLEEQGRTGLIVYIMAGDPDADTTLSLMHSIRDAGADLIELGIPFTDPMADGPVIQAAGLRALASDMSLSGVLELIRRFRQEDTQTPVIAMGYANPFWQYGLDRFAQDAANSGLDGVLCVDMPPEEDTEFRQALAQKSLALIRLATPTSDAARIKKICAGATGFLYYVSVAGVTGAESGKAEEVEHKVGQARISDLPIAVGFGIRTPERAAQLSDCCEAVVVGSGLIERLEGLPPEQQITAASSYIAKISKVL